MKNQYFGDINDYRKYGLLRALQKSGIRDILVAWMLTPDDGGADGGRRDYLTQPMKSRFDAELYDGLKSLLRGTTCPQVSLIETSDLVPCATYYSQFVPDNREARDAWRKSLVSSAIGKDLVFLDPDNGIEVKSRPIGTRDSSKYLAWLEIEELWNTGCSLLIYQHFPRMKRPAFIDSLTQDLRLRIGAPIVAAFQTPHVLFLLAVQAKHEGSVRNVVSYNLENWQGQIDPIALDRPTFYGSNNRGGVVSPTVFYAKGFRFYFFSREEPRMHVHAQSSDGEAKFWLEPEITLAINYRLKPQSLAIIENLIREHEDEIREAWTRHFG